MKKGSRNLTYYLLMMLVFGASLYVVVRRGEHMQTAGGVSPASGLRDAFDTFVSVLYTHINSPIGLLMMQIIVILITCRVAVWLFKKIKQPTVIGEIMAGIILGPSVLGYFFPEMSQFLFPVESLGNINLISQFGLILFMFTIGMELDVNDVVKNWKSSLLISHTSMLVPFFFGALAAYFIYDRYAYEETQFLPFAFFIGIALSISAFPVLARIIQENGLTRTPLGKLTLASAATDNVTAWYILAIIVAVTQAGSMLSALFNIGVSALLIVVMFLVVRPLLTMIGNVYHNKEVMDKALVSLMFLILIATACLTEILGMHALFGAFVAGMIMPENKRFRKIITEKVEDISLALFLPLFFVSTGLRTEIGLLNTPDMWLLCGVFILIAVAGKVGGAVVSARFTGENLQNSLLIGGLMNTRGLMELIVLTIGYEMRILPPTLFVILVLMTLVTTFMTSPLLTFIKFCFRTQKTAPEPQPVRENTFKVLLSFGRAGNGSSLLDVAHQMFSHGRKQLDLTALHLTIGQEVNPQHTKQFERLSFTPILHEAEKLGMQVRTRYDVADDAVQSIVNIANDERFDFLLLGAGISMSNLPGDRKALRIINYFNRIFRPFNSGAYLISPGKLIENKEKIFAEQSRCAVGIFVNRDFVQAGRIIIVINSVDDLILFHYAENLTRSTRGSISILHRTGGDVHATEHILDAIRMFTAQTGDCTVLPEVDLLNESFDDHDFMLVSYRTWNILSRECHEALQYMPSTLIINHKK
jgi:Kef-type K+ transport system membrane component KefB